MAMKNTMRVDFHTHIIAEDFPNLVEKYGDERFPYLQRTCSCGANIIVEQNVFRKITNQAWSLEKRLEDMEREGIDIQVLSPIPVTFSYWSDPLHGLELAKFQNDFIASCVAKYPDRFLGLGTVPLQDTALAIREMERAIDDLHLRGLQIGTNVNGKNLNDESLREFFIAAHEKNVPLFVHPWNTVGKERMTQYNFMYMVGMPSETALAAGSIIMSGMLEELPNLKICFAHGGGSLPYILSRMDKGWTVWPHVRKTVHPPSHYATKLYYDSLVYEPHVLKFMIDRFGSERIIAGSDYPFLLREAPAGNVIDSLPDISEVEKRKMLGENALSFLQVDMATYIPK